MEDRKTLSEEEINIIVNILKEKNNDEYLGIIERLEHLKTNLKKRSKGRKLYDQEKKMARIRAGMSYYAKKTNRNEIENIKLQNYINEFNRVSITKTVRVVGTNIIYEKK